MNLAYQDWLRYAFQEANRELAQDRYDLVHLITYVGWRFPGNFYRLGIPFVWGPIGGLMNTPYRLFPALGVAGAIYYGGRNLLNTLQIHLLRGPRRALRETRGAAIAATSEIQEALLKYFGAESRMICEVGLPEVDPQETKPRSNGEPLQICWSGLHLPGKALHLLLDALARLPRGLNYGIHILGDGPSNRRWRDRAKRLGVDTHCQWHGRLPRDQALAVMRGCHVFVITSLKDLTSTVVLEATALGLPIVCLDHCGFGDLVTGGCGIKIPPTSVQQIVAGLANALSTLYNNDELRCELAQGALARSREYSWQSKMSALEEVYSKALKNSAKTLPVLADLRWEQDRTQPQDAELTLPTGFSTLYAKDDDDVCPHYRPGVIVGSQYGDE